MINTQEIHSPPSAAQNTGKGYWSPQRDNGRPPFTPLPNSHESEERLPSILFSGTLQESTPRKLLQDSRLTALERNAWQVFRLFMDPRGLALSPRYKDLQPFLSMTPLGSASMKTIAKVIANLRTTRWLSLKERGRDKTTGQLKTALYVLHEEPLTVQEALYIDSNYAEHVVKCLKHENKSVQLLARQALLDLQQEEESALPLRVQALLERMTQQLDSAPNRMSGEGTGKTEGKSPQQDGQEPSSVPSSESEEGTEEGKNREKSEKTQTEEGEKKPASDPTSDSEAGRKPSKSGFLPIRKQATTVQKLCTVSKKIHTEPVSTEHPPHRENREHFTTAKSADGEKAPFLWPQVLAAIGRADQQSLQRELDGLESSLSKQVLAEAQRRFETTAINNPAGYLRELIRRAKTGQFNTTQNRQSTSVQGRSNVTQPASRPLPPMFVASPPPPVPDAAQREKARAYLAEMFRIVKGAPLMR